MMCCGYSILTVSSLEFSQTSRKWFKFLGRREYSYTCSFRSHRLYGNAITMEGCHNKAPINMHMRLPSLSRIVTSVTPSSIRRFEFVVDRITLKVSSLSINESGVVVMAIVSLVSSGPKFKSVDESTEKSSLLALTSTTVALYKKKMIMCDLEPIKME